MASENRPARKACLGIAVCAGIASAALQPAADALAYRCAYSVIRGKFSGRYLKRAKGPHGADLAIMIPIRGGKRTIALRLPAPFLDGIPDFAIDAMLRANVGEALDRHLRDEKESWKCIGGADEPKKSPSGLYQPPYIEGRMDGIRLMKREPPRHFTPVRREGLWRVAVMDEDYSERWASAHGGHVPIGDAFSELGKALEKAGLGKIPAGAEGMGESAGKTAYVKLDVLPSGRVAMAGFQGNNLDDDWVQECFRFFTRLRFAEGGHGYVLAFPLVPCGKP